MDGELWEKVEALFIQCADLAPNEASAFLDEACPDPAVREAVQRLLNGDRQEDDLKHAVGRTANSLAETRQDSWIGVQVGAYTVTTKIAEGGMGAVYRARRSDRQYEQEVAIKFLTGAMVTGRLRMRFIAERQILAKLSHVNIAKLLDGGETGNGVPYLVMEYIDGVPLDEYCATNRLTIDDRLTLFLQICSAVQYAHGNLIVHRDIKPSNILVGADGVPKLLDFGIAKILDVQHRSPGAALTMDGSRLLTPRHASPEQILGKQVTTASDVYSLGLLLYELLCGRFPYNLDRTTRASEVEVTIVDTDPVPPSAQVRLVAGREDVFLERRTSPQKLRQKLNGDLDTIVMLALRKEPEARYRSAGEFGDDLRRAMAHLPVVARPPTLPYLVSRYWHRHRTAAIGILATVLATIAGITASTTGYFRAREAERIAVMESRSAAATSEFLVGLFRASDPNETAGKEQSVGEILRLGVERIETGMDDVPVVKSSILETLSGVYKARYDYEEATQLLERALQLHDAHAADDWIGAARLNNDLGDLYRLLEQYDLATDHLEHAYAINRESGNATSEAHADVINNLALVYGLTGREDEVAELLLETLRLRTSLYPAPHVKIALSLHNLAWHYNLVGNPDEAERYGQQALDMRIALFGEAHPRVASTMGEMADIYYDQGRWAASEAIALRALAIAEQIFEPGNRVIAYERNFVARARHAMGDLHSARQLYAQVVEEGRQTLGPDEPVVGTRLKAYARCLLDLGEYEEAETALGDAQAVFEKNADGPPTRLEETQTLLADTWFRSGRLEAASDLLGSGSEGDSQERRLLRARMALAGGDANRAEQLTDDLLREFERTEGNHLPLLPEILQVNGQSQMTTGRSIAAIDTLGKALKIYEDSWDTDYWRADLVRVDLGMALANSGDVSGGLKLLAEAVASLERKFGIDHPDARHALSLLDQVRAAN